MFKVIWPGSGNQLTVNTIPVFFANVIDAVEFMRRSYPKDINYTVAPAKSSLNKESLLQKYYDIACHSLMCYSKNLLMTEPKEGYETEWKQAHEECQLLQELIAEGR